jgi:Lon protease-like protein
LHVFEDRYRVLVRELLALPEQERIFGVVAIRSGREVGADGVRALHEVGCTARLVRAHEHDDGRFDILTVGEDRFALRGVEHDRPYLVGNVDLLDDPPGSGDVAALGSAVRTAYDDYLAALQEAGADVAAGQLPTDTRGLGYAVAGSAVLDLAEKQTLLAEPDVAARLRRELSLLRREARLIRELGAMPAPNLPRSPAAYN